MIEGRVPDSGRERVEEELQFLRVLLENSLDAVLVAEADGTARYVSPSVENMLGYKPEEMVGKKPTDFLHPEDVEQMMREYHEIVSTPGAAGRTLARFSHKDGSWRWIEGVGHNLLHHPVVRGMLNVGRDVTERKEAEDNLQFLSLLVENSLDLIMVADPEGRPIYVNPAHEQVLGYAPEEMKSLKVPDLLHPDDRERVMRQISENIEAPGSITGYIEARYLCKDGSWRWIEGIANNTLEDPVVGGIIYCGRDITRRKEAEAEIHRLNETLEERVRERTARLKESEEAFRLTFDQAGVGMAHVRPDGRFLKVNPKFCEIIGYSEGVLLARTFQDITHSDDLRADLGHTRKMLSGEVSAYSVEQRFVKKDYSHVWVSMTVSLARGASGEPKHFIAIVEDITARKLSEEHLRTLTPREVEVLRFIALGRTNPQIAKEMKFSVGTAKLHAQHIYAKLGVSDRAHAAARAVEMGLTATDENPRLPKPRERIN